MNWWLAKAKHIEEVEDVAKEFKYRFGALPQPLGNPLYMMRIKDSGYEGSGKLRFHTGKANYDKTLETVIGSEAKQYLSRGYDGAVKIVATQIKLDTKLLGDR